MSQMTNEEKSNNEVCSFCKVSETEELLFYCGKCKEDVYCIGCGTISHRKKGHKFDEFKVKADFQHSEYQITKWTKEGTKQIVDLYHKYLTTKNLKTLEKFSGVFKATGVMTFFETAYLSVQWYRGLISWKEWGRGIIRSIAVGGIALAAGVGGAVTGAAVGTVICPGIGTFIGGIIGAICASTGAAYCTISGIDALYDKYWPKEKTGKEKIITTAMKEFGITQDVLKDIDANGVKELRKTIRKTYRALAKIYHPDRCTSDPARFQEILINLGIINGILDKIVNKSQGKDEIEKNAVKMILAIECPKMFET